MDDSSETTKKRLKELSEIRQFSADVKWKLASIYHQFGWKQPQPKEICLPTILQSEQSANDGQLELELTNNNLDAISSLNTAKASISVDRPPNRKDKLLHFDLIKAYHKLASKEEAKLEETQSNEVKRMLKRKRSKQKKLYSSKRLSYTEVVRKLIEHQNEVMASISNVHDKQERSTAINNKDKDG